MKVNKTKVVTIGINGVKYGLTPDGEWFSLDPSKNGSYYHKTEEEARKSAIEINNRLDAEKRNSEKEFNRINSLDENKNIIKINESQLRKLIKESIENAINSNEFKWNNGYTNYVLVDDSDDSVIQNYTSEDGYNAEADAINDAKEKARETHGGSFSVFGCVNDMYDEDSLVFRTTANKNSWKF